ncbi:MAG: 30S ribosomal protein S5 [Patescibacteria group bacterium]|nr:30S ribosomal protein S5 [Patescibacteria group bacterium]MDE1945047.1 30S ribosomal protein S5 [Patescibacteria group bacterium]MDE2057507.1 30S ribosomal protein S5 [Patescibacteria group bacterium]
MDTTMDAEKGTVTEGAAPAPETAQAAATPAPREGDRRTLRGRAPRSPRARAPREKGEFDQATIAVRRVARVMAGGRRFNFSLTLVLGDKKGRVGVGIGKAADTALAIEKATRDAKKHMIRVPRTKGGSIAHDVSAKFASSTVEIMPSPGRGLVAGSAMRTVLELAGVTDVVTKIHTRSKNKLTIARATVEALKNLPA